MGAVYPAGLTNTLGETLALSTTRASLSIPRGYHQAVIYNPTEDYRIHVNPELIDAVFFDESAAAGSEYTQGSLHLQLTDRLGDANGTGTLLDSATGSDFLYLCFYEPVGGIRIDMTASVNGTANTMAGTYRKNDDTWADLSVTDGTDTGASLAQDGDVTWTVPTDWKAATLVGADPHAIVSNDTSGELNTAHGFWCRFTWDNGLDADTETDNIWAINANTTRGYYRSATEYVLSFDRRAVGAIEGVTTANTDTLQITWVRQ